MTRQLQPRHITLGGRKAVALTLEEYERLIVSRRQIGGQSARVRVLSQRVKQSEELLTDLEALIGRPMDDGCPGPQGATGDAAPCHREPEGADGTDRLGAQGPRAAETVSDCLRCALTALLRRHRSGTGGRDPGDTRSPSPPRR
ncbi:hypothetical protein AB0D71_15880 [Streptomyces avermitilis]|uniref:hypothetical protein n=1 Tax=Streptomyces avermitilis TaxID=33903 RepID=UPI0033FD13B8